MSSTRFSSKNINLKQDPLPILNSRMILWFQHIKAWIKTHKSCILHGFSIFSTHSIQVSDSSTMSFKFTSLLIFTITAANVAGQSLSVTNKCDYSVFLFTQTSDGTVSNDLTVAAGASQDMGISSNWDGAINVGECVRC